MISVDSEKNDAETSSNAKRPAPEVPKKKKIPPKAPPKPSKLIRKLSVEEDVLKELDSILEHAFDGETIVEENEDEVKSAKTDDTTTNNGVTKRQSSSNSHRSSKTNSLNRNSDVFISTTDSTASADRDANDNNKLAAQLKRTSLRSNNSDTDRTSGVYPAEPEPDYDVTGVAPPSKSQSQMSQSFEQAADSGISEGSQEALDKKHDGQLSPNSLDHDVMHEGKTSQSDEQEPDYANFATIQETLQRVPVSTQYVTVDVRLCYLMYIYFYGY